MSVSTDLAGTFTVHTSQLKVAYSCYGKPDGWICILLHGFPYDVYCFEECIGPLVDAGARVVVPYLRGYGGTRFLSDKILRSGEQAVLANDLMELMDATSIESAVLAGYDWGGRAACVLAALWPSRVDALVTGNSYNIQHIPSAMEPSSPQEEVSLWYQYYFHSERGRRSLETNRHGVARLLWQMWSPRWNFTDESFEKSALAFENPDFVDVVIHSYRHRFGLVAGDPAVAHIEARLEGQPDITVPTICIDGDVDGVRPSTVHQSVKFTGPHEYRVFKNVGHNIPQEDPQGWVQAILDARQM